MNRALILSGVQIHGGVFRGDKKEDALYKGWQPTFSKTETDELKTDKFLSSHATPF